MTYKDYFLFTKNSDIITIIRTPSCISKKTVEQICCDMVSERNIVKILSETTFFDTIRSPENMKYEIIDLCAKPTNLRAENIQSTTNE